MVGLSCLIRGLSSLWFVTFASGFSTVPNQILHVSNYASASSTSMFNYDARGDYYGESQGSFMIKEFGEYDELKEIVELASQPMPERPDGIVCVVKYTSASREDCKITEAEYERLARSNPSTIFLRSFYEYQDAPLLFTRADIINWPTFDVFYGGNRVARVESSSHSDVEEVLNRYQFQNSELDLFSEGAGAQRWGDGVRTGNPMATPRTTARFLPGYDWNKDRGFFDDLGDQAQQSFEDAFENNWLPNMDDDNGKK